MVLRIVSTQFNNSESRFRSWRGGRDHARPDRVPSQKPALRPDPGRGAIVRPVAGLRRRQPLHQPDHLERHRAGQQRRQRRAEPLPRRRPRLQHRRRRRHQRHLGVRLGLGQRPGQPAARDALRLQRQPGAEPRARCLPRLLLRGRGDAEPGRVRHDPPLPHHYHRRHARDREHAGPAGPLRRAPHLPVAQPHPRRQAQRHLDPQRAGR